MPQYYASRSQEGLNKITFIEQLLRKTATMARMDYLLWIELNALVLNPAFVLPYKRYNATGKDIVMYGNLPEVLAGNVAGARLLTLEPHSFGCRAR